MTIPELDVARVRRWCARSPMTAPVRVGNDIHDSRVELEVAPDHLTIVERRSPLPGQGPEWTRVPRARLRYTPSERLWRLYWCDRDGRFRHYLYDDVSPAPHVEELLDEMERDPTLIFWAD